MDQLRELSPVHVRLRQRARRQLAERVLVGRLARERLAPALQRLADVRLAVAERVPPVHLAVDRRLSRRVARIQLLDEVLELAGIVRLRQPDDRKVAQRRTRDERDVDLGAECRLDVLVVVDAVLRERLLQLCERHVPARELVRQVIDLLPLARAEIAVQRDEGEHVGAHERGARAGRAGRSTAAAARCEQQGECRQEGSDEQAASGHPHSRVGWRPISSQLTRSSACRQACRTGPTPRGKWPRAPSTPLCSFCLELPISDVPNKQSTSS